LRLLQIRDLFPARFDNGHSTKPLPKALYFSDRCHREKKVVRMVPELEEAEGFIEGPGVSVESVNGYCTDADLIRKARNALQSVDQKLPAEPLALKLSIYRQATEVCGGYRISRQAPGEVVG